ncbi:hypothetical protein ATG98_0125 [Marinobacter sp. LV10R520-4]|nr:hypothetical protein ATG98_0125 [Marinobacter sp. LV10R520-4]
MAKCAGRARRSFLAIFVGFRLVLASVERCLLHITEVVVGSFYGKTLLDQRVFHLFIESVEKEMTKVLLEGNKKIYPLKFFL